MHDDEVAVDVDLVARLLADQAPQWAGLPLARVPSSGTDNALFRLGDDLVVRLPRIDWAADDVAKEQRFLPALAPLLPLPVPEPVAQGAPAHGYPWSWSVYRWIDGTCPAAGAVPASLAADLGAFVAALHAADVPGGRRASRGGPLAERDADTRATLPAGPLTAVWERALACPAWDGPDVWVHGDLAPGNLLLRDGRLAAVLDFGALGTGDPACDLLVCWNLLDAADRAVYRSAVGADDATWDRGRGWALTIALSQLSYYAVSNPPLAASARRILSELVDDEVSVRAQTPAETSSTTPAPTSATRVDVT